MKRALPFIGIMAFLLFFYGLQSRDYWAPDEGDFGQVVRELNGNVLVPHLNGAPYAEKPPLFYYMAYIATKVFPVLRDEGSTRLVSAVFALLAALFFAVTLVRFEGRQTALVSSLMLIVTPLYYWQARYLQVDMLFASLVICSLLSFFFFSERRATPFLYLSSLCLGLAFMTKGPVAVALVIPVILIHLYFRNDLQLLKEARSWRALALFFVVVVPWYLIVAVQEGSSFLYENVIRQNFTRFFDAWSHKRPVYYYLTTFPLDFFPWSLFLPMGFIIAVRHIREDTRLRFFLVWFVWMFLFLSLSSGKISKYMLPLLPAACTIASAPLLYHARKYNSLAFFLLSAVFVCLGGVLLFYRKSLYPEFGIERLIFAAICLALSLFLVYFALRRKHLKAFATLFSALFIMFMIANISVFAKLNHYKSPRPLCMKIRSYVGDGTPWVYYGSMRGVYVYYVGKKAIAVDEHKVEELRDLGRRMELFYVLSRKRDLNEVREALDSVEPVIEEKVGDTSMVFVRFKRLG